MGLYRMCYEYTGSVVVEADSYEDAVDVLNEISDEELVKHAEFNLVETFEDEKADKETDEDVL